jgi:uracil phosphoribosyltransferase
MKDHYLTLLRDKNTPRAEFRRAAQGLSTLVAAEAASRIPLAPCTIDTPLAPAVGSTLSHPVALIPILRAGLALLPPFQTLFSDAAIGFFGIRREEKTARPILYYENLPPLSPNHYIFLLDPMLATGGSALLALEKLRAHGADLSRTALVSILAAQDGARAVQEQFPEVQIHAAAIDETLNARHFIVPGLGDFGDRYFGTE